MTVKMKDDEKKDKSEDKEFYPDEEMGKVIKGLSNKEAEELVEKINHDECVVNYKNLSSIDFLNKCNVLIEKDWEDLNLKYDYLLNKRQEFFSKLNGLYEKVCVEVWNKKSLGRDVIWYKNYYKNKYISVFYDFSKDMWSFIIKDGSTREGETKWFKDKVTALKIAADYMQRNKEVINSMDLLHKQFFLREASTIIKPFVDIADSLKSLDEVTRWVKQNGYDKHGYCQSIVALYNHVKTGKAIMAPGHIAYLDDETVYDPIAFNGKVLLAKWQKKFPKNKITTQFIKLK